MIKKCGMSDKFPLKRNKKLEFKVIKTDVSKPYSVRWKVTNVGEIAERKNQIRGQILVDDGYKKRKENSSFYGLHFVECYITPMPYRAQRSMKVISYQYAVTEH